MPRGTRTARSVRERERSRPQTGGWSPGGRALPRQASVGAKTRSAAHGLARCRVSSDRGLCMDVVIRGKNVKVSESLRTAATEHLAKLDRYANGFARAEVDFSEERNPRIAEDQRCEVLVHVEGHLLKAHASASEPFAALYAVCDKVEHQVKRLKDKRVARYHPKRVRTQRVEMPALEDEEEDQQESQTARIVKTKEFTIKPM